MIDLKNKHVLVTGGTGFLGKHVVAVLQRRGAHVKYVGRDYVDLRNKQEAIEFFRDTPQDYVIHLAAVTGGLLFRADDQASVFAENVEIGLNTLQACRQAGVKKVVNVVTSCCFEDGLEKVTATNLHTGKPHPSVEAFAYAKRAVETFGRTLKDMKVVTAALTNLYGVGDSIDLEKTKVVGALVRRFLEAKASKQETIELFGDGTPIREFLYVTDAAELIVQTLEQYENAEVPVLIGPSAPVSVAETATILSRLIGFKGEVKWNNMVGGQPVKVMQVEESYVKDHKFLPFETGLKHTIADFKGRLHVNQAGV